MTPEESEIKESLKSQNTQYDFSQNSSAQVWSGKIYNFLRTVISNLISMEKNKALFSIPT